MRKRILWRNYWYNPSLAGAIIFIILFFALTLLQTAQAIRSICYIRKHGLHRGSKSAESTKRNKQEPIVAIEKVESQDQADQDLEAKHHGSYRFVLILIPFYLGLFCEFLGYIGRTISYDNIDDQRPYIMQTLLLLIGPPFFSASIYMVFGRMVTNVLHNENYLLLYPKYITKVCVVGDIISLLLQAAGGGIMASTQKNINNFSLGENVILGGLGVQILFFGFFVIIEATYYIRLHKNMHSNEYNTKIINQEIRFFPQKFNNWKTVLFSLFICSIFILIRSVYRVVEFSQGNNGYIARHEWFLYFFDALMMFFNAFLFISQDTSNYFLKTIPLTLKNSST